MKKKDHLTTEGLEQIKEIKSVMNRGRDQGACKLEQWFISVFFDAAESASQFLISFRKRKESQTG
jgi:hypothetical protein